jgi:ribonuclease HI
MSILAIVANAAKVDACSNSSEGKCWTRLEPHQVKLNVDASYHSDTRPRAIGAVIRDYEGNFVAPLSTFLPYVASPIMVEALHMREGLSLVLKLGFSRVVVEGDSLEVISACMGDQVWWNESIAIFADCVDLVSQIGSVSFKHYLREANEVAHELAKNSFTCNRSFSWYAEAPHFNVSKLINNVTIL